MLQDLRYAFRQLAKSPGFTTVAVLSLALGIGTNTAIFSVIYGVLLRPLSFPEQERLVTLSEWSKAVPDMSVSYPDFLDWRARQSCFTAVGVTRGQSFNYVGTNSSERLAGAMASHDLFAALGVSALRGRLFTAADDRPGAERVVVIRESLWQRSFGGRDSAIGEKVQLNGDLYTIVGVLPDSLRQFARMTELWAPLGLWADQYQARYNHPGLYGVARLKPDVTFEAAQSAMRALAAQLAQEYPADNTGNSVTVRRFTERTFGSMRPALYVLVRAAGFVLLIACANVANLQLARAHARAGEFSVRAALGASRGRVIGQLLTESLLLGLLGCAVGLILGAWALDGLKSMLPANISRLQEVGLNGWVLAFAVGISLLATVLFGLAPAIQASRQDLRSTLGQGARTSEAASGRRCRAALIVGEFALTCVLLVGTTLMLRTLSNLLHGNLGYTIERTVTFDLELPGAAYRQAAQRLPILERALERLAVLPGVNQTALVDPLPLGDGGNQSGYYIEGTPVPAAGQAPYAERGQVNGDYFATLGIALVAGRSFDRQDRDITPRVAIVDTVFAEKNFPGQNPLGKRFTYGTKPPTKDSDWRQIIGVVAHIKNYGLKNETREQTYVPFTQSVPTGATFVLRSERDPAALIPTLRTAMHEVASDLPVYNFRTMDDRFASSISTERLTVQLLGIFAALALVLAAVGLYGVLSYTVGQRLREIGIRMALGATPRSVVDLVLHHGLKLAGLGLLIGLAVALGLVRFLQSSLYEVSPFDPVSFAVVALVLTAIGALACWLPARRATRVNPVEALRAE